MNVARFKPTQHAGLGLVLIFWCLGACAPTVSAPAPMPTELVPIPALAYYYIWFDASSWERAKLDYPLLGRYSSDDVRVMQQHIQWAKAAGLNGFIVSWKSTEKLNARLAQLAQLAAEADFKLAVIYQGLDFERQPLPATQVAADFDYFIEHYATHPAFQLFEKPVVIWSGTWQFSLDEIASVTTQRREQLLILASEKSASDYQALTGLVDGNAYYWSSVNPNTHPNYLERLTALSTAVHADGGLWIAPAAPGFDARQIGGTSVVERDQGHTLQRELEIALQSAPDALGLISWNEFSENSHLEPSENYGPTYLELLATLRHVTPPLRLDIDSSDFDGATPGWEGVRVVAPLLFLLLIVVSLIAIGLRQNEQP